MLLLHLHVLTLNKNNKILLESGAYEDSCTVVHRPPEQLDDDIKWMTNSIHVESKIKMQLSIND